MDNASKRSLGASKRKNFDNFHIFIKKLVNKKNKKVRVTSGYKDILNNFIIEFTKNIIFKSCYMAREYNKCKIDTDNIETILSILYFSSETIIVNKAYEHLKQYTESFTESKTERKNNRANLIIHPNRIKNMFEKYKLHNIQIYDTTIVFLTAIIEILIGDIISGSLEIMFEENKITLDIEYIYRAIKASFSGEPEKRSRASKESEFKTSSSESKTSSLSSIFKDYDIIGLGVIG